MVSESSDFVARDAPANEMAPLIAHVIYRLQAGGMENGLVNLLNELPAGRYRHAVVCITESTDFADRIRRKDVSIHALHKRPGKDPGVYFRFWRLLRSLRPAVVHTRNLGALDLAPVAALAGVPYRIHGEHGWDAADAQGESRKYRWLRKLCNPAVTQYVAVSRDIERWLHTAIGVPAGKVQRICNGVDTGLFRPDGPAAGLFGVPPAGTDPPVVVGTVGRLDPIKGLDVLVEAVSELIRRDPSVRARLRLVIVGDGPLFGEVSEQLRESGLGDVALLAGRRDDVPAVYRDMDVFVLASRNEGICNTLLEAMASGLPAVATRVGGNVELVDDGATGRLVRPGDANELAESIMAYIDNADLRERHGAAARKRAVENFDLHGMISDYGNLYDRCLDDRHRVTTGHT